MHKALSLGLALAALALYTPLNDRWVLVRYIRSLAAK